uniref:Uncharacterized protein n=1 Tax=Acrobeloides nanus TaxID=290746 RepID=A0A914ELR5_9BILA
MKETYNGHVALLEEEGKVKYEQKIVECLHFELSDNFEKCCRRAGFDITGDFTSEDAMAKVVCKRRVFEA